MKAPSYISSLAIPAPLGAEISDSDMHELKAIVMRKVAWIVLVAYLLLLVKPVMPVIADAMAHTFWKSQHMLTVHEVNGKFHVHSEMAQRSKQTEKERHTTTTKVEVQDCIQVTTPTYLSIQAAAIASVVKYSTYLCYYSFANKRMDYPPPKFLAA